MTLFYDLINDDEAKNYNILLHCTNLSSAKSIISSMELKQKLCRFENYEIATNFAIKQCKSHCCTLAKNKGICLRFIWNGKHIKTDIALIGSFPERQDIIDCGIDINFFENNSFCYHLSNNWQAIIYQNSKGLVFDGIEECDCKQIEEKELNCTKQWIIENQQLIKSAIGTEFDIITVES